MFHANERFQVWCGKCLRKFEADSAEAAMALVQAHEAECAGRVMTEEKKP